MAPSSEIISPMVFFSGCARSLTACSTSSSISSSNLSAPPLDVDLDALDRGRLRRLARAMSIDDLLEKWRIRVQSQCGCHFEGVALQMGPRELIHRRSRSP